jgi:LDH2 family malate/lactate/ureidoglycolate dehydrogenase
MTDFQRVPYETLCRLIAEVLQKSGVPQSQAQLEAEIMAEADLLETPSHGVRMLPGLLTAIAEKRITPNTKVTVLRELGAICVVDCHNGLGRNASVIAMQHAVDRATQFGVGVCLAKNTTHWGRAHAYASRAADQGFIGICTTNALPTMAIAGAKKPVIGNNPLAIGIPGIVAEEPVVLDIAMSQAAVGKVSTWLREGKMPPQNWGIDNDGNATSDAREILKGAVLPMGEHKGAGLAVMFELLTAALAGAALSHEILTQDASGVDPNATKLFIALNIDAFVPREQFAERVTTLLHYLDQEAAPFQYPGERGWQAKQRNLTEGVPLHNEIIAQLASLGIHF